MAVIRLLQNAGYVGVFGVLQKEWMVLFFRSIMSVFFSPFCLIIQYKNIFKNDQKSQCGHRLEGFRRYWCSGFDITSRWSSKGPFNSPETILRHVEYLIFWFSMKFAAISNFTVFSYHLTHENSTFFNIVFDL